jgi:hypothetical protein
MPTTVYFKDFSDNFYKSVVLEGNIFGENARLQVFMQVNSEWVSLGERVTNNGIRVGKPLWGVITIKSFYVQNQS